MLVELKSHCLICCCHVVDGIYGSNRALWKQFLFFLNWSTDGKMNAQIIFCILLLLRCHLCVPLSEENNMPGKLCPMPESLDNIGLIFCCLDATQNNSTNTFLSLLSFTNEVSEWAKLTHSRSVVKGINFHIEKISPVHIGMQNVCLCVCLSVWR